MTSNEVNEETDDRIVLVENRVKNVLIALSTIEFIVGLFVMFIASIISRLWLCAAILLLAVVYGPLSKESIIIDKRLKKVIVTKDSFIKYFKSTKEVPFSRVKEIEITYCSQVGHSFDSQSTGVGNWWLVSLILSDGEPVPIYDGDRHSKSEVEKIAGKICEITGKKVTHQTAHVPDTGG